MKRSPVAILHSHPLFGEGIRLLLHSDEALRVTCIPAQDKNAYERLRKLRPHIIVIEASHDSTIWQELPDLPWATVIRVSLEEEFMHVFYGHAVVSAAPEELVKIIHSALRRRAS